MREIDFFSRPNLEFPFHFLLLLKVVFYLYFFRPDLFFLNHPSINHQGIRLKCKKSWETQGSCLGTPLPVTFFVSACTTCGIFLCYAYVNLILFFLSLCIFQQLFFISKYFNHPHISHFFYVPSLIPTGAYTPYYTREGTCLKSMDGPTNDADAWVQLHQYHLSRVSASPVPLAPIQFLQEQGYAVAELGPACRLPGKLLTVVRPLTDSSLTTRSPPATY